MRDQFHAIYILHRTLPHIHASRDLRSAFQLGELQSHRDLRGLCIQQRLHQEHLSWLCSLTRLVLVLVPMLGAGAVRGRLAQTGGLEWVLNWLSSRVVALVPYVRDTQMRPCSRFHWAADFASESSRFPWWLQAN